MFAETNSWSVTFYGEQKSDSQLLFKLALVAKKRGISFGSVNVLLVILPKSAGDTIMMPHLWLPYFGEKKALTLLKHAGISADSVTFKKVKFVEDNAKDKKRAITLK